MKKSLKSLGAAGVAAATLVSGLSFGPAAVAATPAHSAATSATSATKGAAPTETTGDLKLVKPKGAAKQSRAVNEIPFVLKDASGQYYGFERSRRYTSSGDNLAVTYFYLASAQSSYADAAARTLSVTMGTPGTTEFQIKDVNSTAGTCIGQSRLGFVYSWDDQANNSGCGFQSGRHEGQRWSTSADGTITNSMTGGKLRLERYSDWRPELNNRLMPYTAESGGTTPVVGPGFPDDGTEIENGGVEPSALGFSSTVDEGKSTLAYFGLQGSERVSTLTDMTTTLTAPNGTRFTAGTTSVAGQWRNSGSENWRSESGLNGKASVSSDGKTMTVTFDLPTASAVAKGGQLRWAAPIDGVTPGNGDVGISMSGKTNYGSFSASGKSTVTVQAASASNGGIATSGDGYPTTLKEGEDRNVAFGVTTTGNISSISNNTFSLTAPTGTKFTSGTTSLSTQFSANGRDWDNSLYGPATLSVASGGRTATVHVTTTGGFNIEEGYKLRWVVPLTGVTAGTGDMTFTGTGTTNNGTFTASGSSPVTVNADSDGFTAGATFDSDVTQEVKISGTATSGRTIKISDLSDNELASTTARNGTYEVRVPAQGSGTQRFYVDEYNGSTHVDEKSVVADYGRAVDITSPANNASVGDSAFDLAVNTQTGASLTVKDGNTQLFTRTAGSATETFNISGLSAGAHNLTVVQVSKGNLTTTDSVTVNATAPITNGGISTSGDGYPVTLTEGEEKNVAFGVTTTGNISSISNNTFTLTAPTGTKFTAGTTSTTTQYSADGSTWNNSVYGPATVSVASGGKTATVEVTTSGGFNIEQGYKLRWGIPLTAVTAGTGDMTFTGTGTTNNGTFTASGSSRVTVNANPIANGGIDTDALGFSTTLEQGKQDALRFGLQASEPIHGFSNVTTTIDAPAGTRFTTGISKVDGQWRNTPTDSWKDADDLQADVSVYPGGGTAVVTFKREGEFYMSAGGGLRWALPIEGLETGATDVPFSLSGTSSLGAFASSGSSRVTVTDSTADSAAPTDVTGEFLTNVTDKAKLSGKGVNGSTITIKQGSTTLGTATVENGTWSYNPDAPGTGNRQFTVTQKTGDRPVSSGVNVSLDYGRGVDITSPANNADLPVEKFDLRVDTQAGANLVVKDGNTQIATTTATGATATIPIPKLVEGTHPLTVSQVSKGNLTTTDSVTVKIANPVANGGFDAIGDGYPTELKVGETKDVRWGITSNAALNDLEDGRFTVTAPTGTRFVAGTDSLQTEYSNNGVGWANSSSVTASSTVANDGKTMEVSIGAGAYFNVASGGKLRWVTPLTGVSVSDRNLTFSGTGSTNHGNFSVSGSSRITVVEDTSASAAPTDVSAKFESAVTDKATISGNGVTGSTITITSGGTSEDVEVVDGKWSYRPVAPGAGEREFTVTQKTGNRPVSDAVKVSLDYGRAVDVTSPADNAELPAGGFDLDVDTQQDAQLVVKDGNTEVATATATGATASVEIPALSAGSHELTVSQVSKGNLTTTDKVTVTIGEDNTKPGAPTAEGYFPEDVAQWASVTGTGTVGATVVAVDGKGTEIGRTTITAADGSYNIPVDPNTVGYGVVSLNVTQSVDGQTSDPVSVALDYGQNTPAFTSPTNGDNVANKDLTFTGTGNAGGKVQVNGTDFTDSTAIGSSDVTGADDSWSVSNQDLTLQNGPYQLWANQRTKGGKIEFTGINVQVVDAKPAAPTVQGYFPQNVSEWAGVAGTATVGSTVIARDADGNEIGRTEVTDPKGTYNIGINPGKVGYGVVKLTVTQTVGAATSDGVDVDLDYGQNTPEITSPITGATVPNKGLTLTGKGNPGGELEVNGTDFTDATRLGAASLGAGTDWTVSNNELKLPNGNYQLWANQRTKGGKIEFTGVGVNVAPVKPAAPTAEGYFPQDIAQWAGITGLGAPNATVTATDAAGNVIGEAVAGTNGSYNIGIDPTKVGYGVVQLTVSQQSDGVVSDGIDVDLDYGQNTPAFTTPTDNATVPNKGLNFAGTGNPGGHVQVNGTDMTNATAIGSSAVSGADNTWSVSNDTLTLPVGGAYQLWANQRTKGGKIEFTGINIHTEVAKPAAPTAKGNFAENDQEWAWIDGTATKGATVTVTDDQGKEIGSGVVDQNSGYYRISVDPTKVGMGTVNLAVTQTIDGAESASVPVSLDYGTAAPIAITSPTDGSTIGGGSQLTISGTGADGATVSVSGVDPSNPASATAFGTPTVTDGNWSVTPTLDLPAGNFQFWAHQFSKGGKYTNSAVNTVITR